MLLKLSSLIRESGNIAVNIKNWFLANTQKNTLAIFMADVFWVLLSSAYVTLSVAKNSFTVWTTAIGR